MLKQPFTMMIMEKINGAMKGKTITVILITNDAIQAPENIISSLQ